MSGDDKDLSTDAPRTADGVKNGADGAGDGRVAALGSTRDDGAGLEKIGEQLQHDLLRTIEIQQDALRTAQDELAEHDSALAHGYMRHRARRTRMSGLRVPPALLLVVGAVVLALIGGPQASMIIGVGLVILLAVLILGRFVLVLALVRKISGTEGAAERALGAILGSGLNSLWVGGSIPPIQRHDAPTRSKGLLGG